MNLAAFIVIVGYVCCVWIRAREQDELLTLCERELAPFLGRRPTPASPPPVPALKESEDR